MNSAPPAYGQPGNGIPPQYGQAPTQGAYGRAEASASHPAAGSQQAYGAGAQPRPNAYPDAAPGAMPPYPGAWQSSAPGYPGDAPGGYASAAPGYAPGPAYGQPYPPYSPYAPVQKSPIVSILSMVGGIAGIVLSGFYGIGVLFAIAGVVLGFIGRRRDAQRGHGFWLTGLITGFIGIFFSLVVIAIVIIAISIAANNYHYGNLNG